MCIRDRGDLDAAEPAGAFGVLGNKPREPMCSGTLETPEVIDREGIPVAPWADAGLEEDNVLLLDLSLIHIFRQRIGQRSARGGNVVFNLRLRTRRAQRNPAILHKKLQHVAFRQIKGALAAVRFGHDGQQVILPPQHRAPGYRVHALLAQRRHDGADALGKAQGLSLIHIFPDGLGRSVRYFEASG